MQLEIDSIRRSFGGTPVLRDISFALAPGTIGCLLGPSGCGKTTLLRIIAGFEAADAGRVLADGCALTAPGVQLAPHARRIGMVFQDHALFPHLDVLANVAFGLHDQPAKERRARALELIDAVGLAGLAARRPHELSGGQQQRVELARALAPGPQLLLLDEPLSSLDAELRRQLGAELRQILKRYGTTALLVTHDQQEAFAIADEVGVMRDGLIEQWATPYDLYHRPATRFVAEFVGSGTFVVGRWYDRYRARRRKRPACGGLSLHPRLDRGPAAAPRRCGARRCQHHHRGGARQGLPRRGLPLHAATG